MRKQKQSCQQRSLFDHVKPPSDTVVMRMRIQKKALRMIRGKWFGMPLDEAMRKLMGVRHRGRRRYVYKYVRLVSGRNVFQARAWHPVIKSVHLGCYLSEREAWSAVKEWIRAGCHPCKGLRDGVLPKWVERDGNHFRVTDRGKLNLGIDRVFETAEEAHMAAMDVMLNSPLGFSRRRYRSLDLFAMQPVNAEPSQFVA